MARLCGQTIQELRRDGFRIVLDDFGTGYSSLSCLRSFPVDKIKLDRSFIDIAARDQSVAIIRAAVTLGHAMDLEVVAEGISSREEEQIALEAGCDGAAGPSLRAGHAGRARSPPISPRSTRPPPSPTPPDQGTLLSVPEKSDCPIRASLPARGSIEKRGMSTRSFALVLGLVFVALGVAGFIPFLAHPEAGAALAGNAAAAAASAPPMMLGTGRRHAVRAVSR